MSVDDTPTPAPPPLTPAEVEAVRAKIKAAGNPVYGMTIRCGGPGRRDRTVNLRERIAVDCFEHDVPRLLATIDALRAEVARPKASTPAVVEEDLTTATALPHDVLVRVVLALEAAYYGSFAAARLASEALAVLPGAVLVRVSKDAAAAAEVSR